MSTRFRLGAVLSGLLILAVCWQWAPAQESAASDAKPPKISAELLGGDDRYLTHVSTDKPIYRPGEKLYVRGVVLHQFTSKPLAENASATAEIIGPKGDVVASGLSNCEDGVLAFSWDIPPSQAGGQYTVKFNHPWTGHAPAERKFDIRAYRPPRLRSQIKFLRDGYGPGDEAVATLEVTRAEGGIPVGAKVTIVARVDGAEAFRGESLVDASGRCVARFKLPAEIARGEGSLAMVIDDSGVVETASKTIPILLQTVDLTMYPEGGDLIAGLLNRVYFEAFTPAKKPADLSGIVVDSEGRRVAEFRSEHEGRGRFTFTPVAGQKYELKITEPAGIRTTYPLPAAKQTGILLSSLADVFKKTVRLRLTSTNDQSVAVTLNKREHELIHKEMKLLKGQPTEVDLPSGDASGILVATVWDASGKPLAERLVFAQPRHEVRVAIIADRPRYVPGGKATLAMTTTDESGKPASAVIGITVTNDTVLEMIERREQAPRLPAMVLLETDVKELADADVYFDAKNPQAPAAVDLLLGTQGWRRFAFVELPKFVNDHGDAARRVLAFRMPTQDELWRRRGAFGGGGADHRFFRWSEADRSDADFFALVPEDKALADGAPEGQPAPAAAPVEVDLGIVANGPALLKQLSDVAELPASEEAAAKEFPERDRLAAGLAFGSEPLAEGLVIGDDFVAVRIYAHTARPDRKPGERTDFTETLFWHAGIKTDDAGKATIEFDLNDAVTSFRVLADAFNATGSLGSAVSTIESVEPFYVEPKLPLEVTSGDVVIAPISLINGTDQSLQSSLTITLAGHEQGDSTTEVQLPSDGRVRHLARLPIGTAYGTAALQLTASASQFTDNSIRTIEVKPSGFPVERGRGGLLEPGAVAEHIIEIPETVVAGSIRTKAVVYPTPLASLTEALARLIQEPSGCFEQTSSTIYPLVMAQQYFLDHQGVDPSLVERSATVLETGYQRLIGFESKSGGYEWFGADPGHDALTAYGLMEFTDMARVRHVDPDMLARTRKWFLEQRDGKGGFARKTATLHSWLPDPEVANTYNTWALFQAGVEGDFKTEVDWVRDAAGRTPNTYVIALAANVLAAAGDKNGEARLLDKLAGLQQPDGSLSGATVSVVGSTGEALQIETTALAVLAWLRDDHYAEQVEKGIQYLAECCKGGRFGSTQSTVLALRAIIEYDRARAKPEAPGELRLIVDGQPVGDLIPFTPDTQGAIELPSFTERLTPGRHQVELHMTGGSKMPFSIAVNYSATKPDSSDDCKLDVKVALADTNITEGELTEARLHVTNRSDETVPNPIAIVGIPGGLEVRHDQLKELVKAGKIAAYEVLGRDLVIYWRSLKANEQVELPVSVVAAIPGQYTSPASRAYLYYTDEDKNWADPLKVEIAPRPWSNSHLAQRPPIATIVHVGRGLAHFAKSSEQNVPVLFHFFWRHARAASCHISWHSIRAQRLREPSSSTTPAKSSPSLSANSSSTIRSPAGSSMIPGKFGQPSATSPKKFSPTPA